MRVLIVSDLHANPAALEVLPDADVVVCGGDLVDYGPDPRAAIAFCRERAAIMVGGNHDVALAYDVSDGVTSAMAGPAALTRSRHRRMLSEADVLWLRSLPHVTRFAAGDLAVGVCHAVPGDVHGYAPLAQSAPLLHAAVPGARLLVLGHTHVPGIERFDDVVAVNPGSAGMSERGGSVDFALWEDGVLEPHRVAYDVERTVFAIRKAHADAPELEPLVDAFISGRRSSGPSGTTTRVAGTTGG